MSIGISHLSCTLHRAYQFSSFIFLRLHTGTKRKVDILSFHSFLINIHLHIEKCWWVCTLIGSSQVSAQSQRDIGYKVSAGTRRFQWQWQVWNCIWESNKINDKVNFEHLLTWRNVCGGFRRNNWNPLSAQMNPEWRLSHGKFSLLPHFVSCREQEQVLIWASDIVVLTRHKMITCLQCRFSATPSYTITEFWDGPQLFAYCILRKKHSRLGLEHY